MSRPSRSLAVLPLAAGLLLAACGNDDSAKKSSTAPARLTLTAREYSLDAAGVRTLPAGSVTVTVRNEGRQEHGVQIYRLKDGVTFARFKRVLRKSGDEALLPLIASSHGGANNVVPGKPWRATLTLPAGTYALEDFGETPKGEHNARDHGMVTAIRVTASQRAAAAEPRETTNVSIAERGCRVPSKFPRSGTLAISTHGSGVHEFALSRVQPRTAARELRRVTDGDPNTFPEGDPVDLLGATSGGQTVYVAADLRPGTYVALCMSAHPGRGLPSIRGSVATVG